MRLFVSVDLPASLTESVRELQAGFDDPPGLEFVDPGQAHVTLKFLGDVADSEYDALVAALSDAVADADVGPFDATFGGLGVFPSLDYIRVVWLGVEDGAGELAALHDAAEDACVGLGFDPAEHEFTPHVTLGRMKHAGGKERVQAVVRERHPVVGTVRIEEVRLTESARTDAGAVYETRERFALGAD